MENCIKVYNDVFTSDMCDELINAWHEVPHPSRANEPSRVNSVHFRNDEVVFIDRGCEEDTPESDQLKRDLSSKVWPLLMEASIRYMTDLGLFTGMLYEPDAIKVQKYSAAGSGGYHSFHYEQEGTTPLEVDPEQTQLRRKFTWLLYLNDVPAGEGETEFLYQGIRQQPKKGDLVVFPAFYTHTHRGNPVYTTDKYIATGWFLWPNCAQHELQNLAA